MATGTHFGHYSRLSGLSLLNEPRFDIALEQSQRCVQATTATSWHVMLILLQLRELLRPPELSRTLETTTPLRHGTNRVAVNGANAMVVGLSRTTPSHDSFIAAQGLGDSVQLICVAPLPIRTEME